MCGKLTSSTVAPINSSCAIAALTVVATLGSIPSPKYSLGTAIFKPLTSPVNFEVKSGTSRFDDVESFSSKPAIVFKTKALSLTVRVKGPI